MTRPGKSSRLSIEGLLQLVQKATGRLRTLSSDPRVQEEAVNVGKAVSKLLQAIRESQHRPTRDTAKQDEPTQDQPTQDQHQ